MLSYAGLTSYLPCRLCRITAVHIKAPIGININRLHCPMNITTLLRLATTLGKLHKNVKRSRFFDRARHGYAYGWLHGFQARRAKVSPCWYDEREVSLAPSEESKIYRMFYVGQGVEGRRSRPEGIANAKLSIPPWKEGKFAVSCVFTQ